MKKFLAILNLIIVIALIAWNYLSNTGIVNDNTIGSLSRDYENLFTPAGYAFSIWGVIFTALLLMSVFTLVRSFNEKEDAFIMKVCPWLIIANILNAAWVYFWLLEYTLLTVFIMFSILISLTVIILKTKMEKIRVEKSIKIWIWWPIGIYLGWITVASIANVSTYLAKIEFSALFSEISWTIIMIITATIINLLLIITRRMKDFALVGIWALTAIAYRHWENIPQIAWTAVLCSIIITAFIIVNLIRKKDRIIA